MSLYSELRDLKPLPNQEEYTQSHTLAEAFFVEENAWGDVAHQFARVAHDPELKQNLLTVSQYGFLLQEDMLTNTPQAEPAPKFLVGRAFAQGFTQQLMPTQLVYKSDYSLENAINVLGGQYASQNFQKLQDPSDPEGTRERLDRFNSEYVYALGEYGIAQAGEGAEAYIDKWANEAYYADARLAKAFRIGHGAMVICAMNYQLGINDKLIRYASNKVNLDQEVLSILSPSTSEDE